LATIGVYSFSPLRDWPVQCPDEYLHACMFTAVDTDAVLWLPLQCCDDSVSWNTSQTHTPVRSTQIAYLLFGLSLSLLHVPNV